MGRLTGKGYTRICLPVHRLSARPDRQLYVPQMQHPLLKEDQIVRNNRLPAHCRHLRLLRHYTVIPVATQMSLPPVRWAATSSSNTLPHNSCGDRCFQPFRPDKSHEDTQVRQRPRHAIEVPELDLGTSLVFLRSNSAGCREEAFPHTTWGGH